jgi:hypothetical protein
MTLHIKRHKRHRLSAGAHGDAQVAHQLRTTAHTENSRRLAAPVQPNVAEPQSVMLHVKRRKQHRLSTAAHEDTQITR